MLRKTQIEQAIKIAKASKDKIFQTDINLDEAAAFATCLRLKPGEHKVLCPAIYNAYKRWSKRPITKKHFFLLFAQIFEKQTNHIHRFYLLNYDALQLKQEAAKNRHDY